MAPKKAAPAKKTTASKTTAAKATAKKTAPAKAAKKAPAKPVAKKSAAKLPLQKRILFQLKSLLQKLQQKLLLSQPQKAQPRSQLQLHQLRVPRSLQRPSKAMTLS